MTYSNFCLMWQLIVKLWFHKSTISGLLSNLSSWHCFSTRSIAYVGILDRGLIFYTFLCICWWLPSPQSFLEFLLPPVVDSDQPWFLRYQWWWLMYDIVVSWFLWLCMLMEREDGRLWTNAIEDLGKESSSTILLQCTLPTNTYYTLELHTSTANT